MILRFLASLQDRHAQAQDRRYSARLSRNASLEEALRRRRPLVFAAVLAYMAARRLQR